jgi:hypothetical protein
VFELSAVLTPNDFVVLRPRLILLRNVLRMRLIILLRGVLRAWLVVAAMALVISLMVPPVRYVIGTMILRLIGERLRSDTHTQQTNTGQTPDVRLHAFPHCGLGPVRKTEKPQAGSATGYQSRNLFRRQ